MRITIATKRRRGTLAINGPAMSGRLAAAWRSAGPVRALAGFHLHALVLAGVDVIETRLDAGLIGIKRALVVGARIDRWRRDLGRTAAARKCASERECAKREKCPPH